MLLLGLLSLCTPRPGAGATDGCSLLLANGVFNTYATRSSSAASKSSQSAFQSKVVSRGMG